MIRFTVVGDPDVESPFINTWVAGDASTRAILTEIANWVDSNLAEDPDAKGQPRPDLDARILAVPVSSSRARISVTYQVLPDDRLVRIVRLVFRGT
jgi:hypothetical protein